MLICRLACLYLVAEPLTACTFNEESGVSYEYDQTVSGLRATPNTGYTFLGWYDGARLMSENLTFSFNMPDRDVVWNGDASAYPYMEKGQQPLLLFYLL